MLQEPFLQCRVFEEEGLEAVILAINAEKVWVARNSQTNSNVLVLIEDLVFTRYGVTISDIRSQKTRMKTGSQSEFIRVDLWLNSRQQRVALVCLSAARALSSVE